MPEKQKSTQLASQTQFSYYLNLARSQRGSNNDFAISNYGNAIASAQKENNRVLTKAILAEAYYLTAKWADAHASNNNIVIAKDYYVLAATWANAAGREQISRQYYAKAATMCKRQVIFLDKISTSNEYLFGKMMDYCKEGTKYAEKSGDFHLTQDLQFLHKMLIMCNGIRKEQL